ncbi:MAG: hypothetical protein ACFFD2_17015 [Promethearchaeota archaeon]
MYKTQGFVNIIKHIQLKCIAMLIVALAAAWMGRADLTRCIRYFQS